MSLELILIILSCVLYCVASFFAFVSFLRPTKAAERKGTTTIILATVSLAAFILMHCIHKRELPISSWPDAVIFYSFVITLVYIYISMKYETRALSVMLIPFISILIIASAIKTAISEDTSMMPNIWLALHIITALTGYALFTLAGALAIAYLLQDRNLKHKHFGTVFRRLPALETLDQLMSEQISFAFVIFSVSILLGVGLAHIGPWKGWHWIIDPKILTTMVTWLIYAILFYMQRSADYHGKKVAIVTLGGFLCVILTSVGVPLISDTLHSFGLSGGQ